MILKRSLISDSLYVYQVNISSYYWVLRHFCYFFIGKDQNLLVANKIKGFLNDSFICR